MAMLWTKEAPQHKVSSPRVGIISELLNEKYFGCNLLNQLCQSNVFNEYYLSPQIECHGLSIDVIARYEEIRQIAHANFLAPIR